MTINGVQPATTNSSPKNIQIKKLSEDEIQKIAVAKPYQKISDVRKNALYTVFLGIPVADSFIKSTLTSGNLYKKTSTFAKNSAHWAGVYAIGLGVLELKKAINNKVETLDYFDYKHPIASFGVDMTVLYTALSLARLGAEKIKNQIKEKAPQILKSIDKKITKPLSKKLNQTNFSKNQVKTLDKYIAKHPYTKAAGIVLTIATAPIIAIATVVRQNKEINSAIKEANNNYTLLSMLNSMLPENEEKAQNIDTANETDS